MEIVQNIELKQIELEWKRYVKQNETFEENKAVHKNRTEENRNAPKNETFWENGDSKKNRIFGEKETVRNSEGI